MILLLIIPTDQLFGGPVKKAISCLILKVIIILYYLAKSVPPVDSIQEVHADSDVHVQSQEHGLFHEELYVCSHSQGS